MVPQSSQIQFLSQLNEAFNSPSTASSHSTPTLHVQGSVKQQMQPIPVVTESTQKKNEKETQKQEIPLSQSIPQVDNPIPVTIPAIREEVTLPVEEKQPKQRRKRRASPSSSPQQVIRPLEEERYYAFLINRLRGKPLTVDSIRKEYCLVSSYPQL